MRQLLFWLIVFMQRGATQDNLIQSSHQAATVFIRLSRYLLLGSMHRSPANHWKTRLSAVLSTEIEILRILPSMSLRCQALLKLSRRRGCD